MSKKKNKSRQVVYSTNPDFDYDDNQELDETLPIATKSYMYPLIGKREKVNLLH